MIKGLMGAGGIVVDGGNTSMPYVNMSQGNMSNPMQGMLRINGSDMQVWDGNSWMTLATSYATVRLDPNTESLLKWCEAQRTMAMRRVEMAAKHPALEKALEAIKRAEDNFDILEKFVEHDNGSDVQTGP